MSRYIIAHILVLVGLKEKVSVELIKKPLINNSLIEEIKNEEEIIPTNTEKKKKKKKNKQIEEIIEPIKINVSSEVEFDKYDLNSHSITTSCPPLITTDKEWHELKLSPHLWLVICKLIACAQGNNDCSEDDIVKILNETILSYATCPSNNSSIRNNSSDQHMDNGHSNGISPYGSAYGSSKTKPIKITKEDKNNKSNKDVIFSSPTTQSIWQWHRGLIANQVIGDGNTKINYPTKDFANFYLGISKTTFKGGDIDDHFDASIVGWEMYEESYQNVHVKFKIISSTSLSATSYDGITVANGSGDNNHNSITYKTEVMRRYSDFELLVLLLQRLYKGVIIPPLPVKHYSLQHSDANINLRSRELQMFINSITNHPILRHTYELKAFLEASSRGFKAYKEMFKKFHIDTIDSNQYIEAIGNIVSEVASLATSTAYGLVSSFITTGSQWIGATPSQVLLTTSPSPISSPSIKLSSSKMTIEQILEKITLFLTGIIDIGDKMNIMLDNSNKSLYELSQLGYFFKQLGDLGESPSLDFDLIQTSEQIDLISKSNQEIYDKLNKFSLTPTQYLGRYNESIKIISQQKDISSDLVKNCIINEDNCRKLLDLERLTKGVTNLTISKHEESLSEANKKRKNAKNDESLIISSIRTEVEFFENYEKVKLKVFINYLFVFN